jgi:hypothetical protein
MVDNFICWLINLGHEEAEYGAIYHIFPLSTSRIGILSSAKKHSKVEHFLYEPFDQLSTILIQ